MQPCRLLPSSSCRSGVAIGRCGPLVGSSQRVRHAQGHSACTPSHRTLGNPRLATRASAASAAASHSASPSSWSDSSGGQDNRERGQEERIEAAVLLYARSFRSIFLCLAGFAAWAYICSGTPSGSPFASIAIAVEGSTGHEVALKAAWTGMATGVLHTLCGPDHLAGLAPLSIGRSRMAAAALGAVWGFGHSTGQMILGLVFMLLKDKFHDFMPALDRWAAYIVPLTLMTIGFVGIYENMNKDKEGEGDHDAAADAAKGSRAGVATYLTGIVHGLQPDALFVVVPALALPTKLAAVAFISMFVVGTCFSMGMYTFVLSTTSKALIKEQPWLQSHLSSVACGIAILFGVGMLLGGPCGLPIPFFS